MLQKERDKGSRFLRALDLAFLLVLWMTETPEQVVAEADFVIGWRVDAFEPFEQTRQPPTQVAPQ